MFKASGYEQWLTILQGLSKICQQYNGFLPAQVKLLREIYDSITVFDEKVVTFTAPPASGKTHVIVLFAVYLSFQGYKSCIVTPNGELSVDFKEEFKQIIASDIAIPVLSIPAYRKIKDTFDFVLMDEAHNLRSALELDSKLLKSFHFKEGDGFYETLIPPAISKKYNSRELNIETASDVLKKLCDTDAYIDAKPILKTLTQWRCYCVSYGDMCVLKFLQVDPKKRNIIPKGRLFLFSATRLTEEELGFYCNIPKDFIKTLGEGQSVFTPKTNVSYGYIACETEDEKIKVSLDLLQENTVTTLILLNNKSNCEIWASEFNKKYSNRVISIESGLKHSQRISAYKKFLEKEGNILITSSNVFWEGITIKQLKLLLIPNIPFPQPTMLELTEGKSPEYQKIAERRLIQGIGRVGRVAKSKGVCLLFFKPPKSFGYFVKVPTSEINNFVAKNTN
jgi:Helicase conserved C-terminal domain